MATSKIDIIKELLSKVGDSDFKCEIYSTDGFDGWNSDDYLTFSAPQLLYLIKSTVRNDDLFEGIRVEQVDVDSKLAYLSQDLSWPDGYPSPNVLSVIPDELEALAEEISNFIKSESCDSDQIKRSLQSIQSGEYTFNFSIGSEYYYFSESAEQKIELERTEILGLLLGQFDIEYLLDEDIEVYGEDFLNDIAEEKDLASIHDPFSYGGSSEELESYLHAWGSMIQRILDDEISEEYALLFTKYLEEGDYGRDYDEWLEAYLN